MYDIDCEHKLDVCLDNDASDLDILGHLRQFGRCLTNLGLFS